MTPPSFFLPFKKSEWVMTPMDCFLRTPHSRGREIKKRRDGS